MYLSMPLKVMKVSPAPIYPNTAQHFIADPKERHAKSPFLKLVFGAASLKPFFERLLAASLETFRLEVLGRLRLSLTQDCRIIQILLAHLCTPHKGFENLKSFMPGVLEPAEPTSELHT